MRKAQILPIFPCLLLVAGPAALSAAELDRISVTASRIERDTAEEPSALTVIDGKRIEAAKMLNIKDAIQGTPGVLIDSKNGGYDVRLMIRGAGQKANYGVREIMVLRDGVPMTDPDSFSRFDFIDTQDIERIEITRGPGSLYGAGSAGGTIQIISKSVFDGDQNRIKLGLGEAGTRLAHMRLGGDMGENGAFSVTASHRETDNGWRDWNEFDTQQISFKHGLMLDDGSTLETELSYSQADMQIPAKMDEAEFAAFRRSGEQHDTSDPWQQSGRYSTIWFFNSRLEKDLGKLVFKPRIYFNRWEHFHPVTGVINDNAGTNVLGTDLEFSYAHDMLGPATLVAGITLRVDDTDDARKYQYQDVRYNPFSGRLSAVLSDTKGDLLEQESATNTLFGLYALESIALNERTSLDLGLRLERMRFNIDSLQYGEYSWSQADYVDFDTPTRLSTDKEFDLFAPKIGLTYRLNPAINLYGVIAQSGQLPSEAEIQENPSLDAATARNIEVGIKGRSQQWSFDMALYRTTVEDEIVSLLNGWQTEFQNAGKTLKLGLELNASLQLGGGFSLDMGYAFSDHTFDEFTEVIYGVGNLDRSGNQIPYVPRHQYSLGLGYHHPMGLSARIQADGWGEYYMDNANTEMYQGYDLLTRLSLAYETGPHTLSLNVDNLFDKRYAVEAKKDTSGRHSYSAGAPRSAMLSYRYRF